MNRERALKSSPDLLTNNDLMYYLFAGDNYYPCGGVEDFQSSHSTLEKALRAAALSNYDWWHIADSNMQIVEGGS